MFFHSLSDSREPLVRARRAAGRPDSLHLTPLRICTVVMPPSRETRYKNSGDANFRSICTLSAPLVTLQSRRRLRCHVAVAAPMGVGGWGGWGVGSGVGGLPTRLSCSSATGRALTTTIRRVYTKAQKWISAGEEQRVIRSATRAFHFFSFPFFFFTPVEMEPWTSAQPINNSPRVNHSLSNQAIHPFAPHRLYTAIRPEPALRWGKDRPRESNDVCDESQCWLKSSR